MRVPLKRLNILYIRGNSHKIFQINSMRIIKLYPKCTKSDGYSAILSQCCTGGSGADAASTGQLNGFFIFVFICLHARSKQITHKDTGDDLFYVFFFLF